MNWKTELVRFVVGGVITEGTNWLINHAATNVSVNKSKGTTEVKVTRNNDNQKLFSYKTDEPFFKK